MATLTTLSIPIFTARPRPAPANTLPRALVAAVRWDYEYALMSRADIARKYAAVVSRDAVYDIANGTTHRGILAVRNDGAHCNPKWRLKK